MGVFDSISEDSEKIADSGQRYFEKSQEYFKLKIFQQLVISISIVTKVLVIGGFLFVSLFFLAFSAALALGEWLGDQAYGYLIIGLVFLVCVFMVYLYRNVINKKIVQLLSKKFFDS